MDDEETPVEAGMTRVQLHPDDATIPDAANTRRQGLRSDGPLPAKADVLKTFEPYVYGNHMLAVMGHTRRRSAATTR